MENIKAIMLSKHIDRSKEPMPTAWLWDKDVVQDQSLRNLIKDFLCHTKEVICIQSVEIKDTEVIGLLHNLAKSNKRVYILVSKYTTELDSLRGKCLIRQAELPTNETLLIRDPNTTVHRGMFLSESLATLSGLGIEYSTGKIEKLFCFFCYLFWECSTTEWITPDTNGISITSKGVDVYFDTSLLDTNYLYDTLLTPIEGLSRSNFNNRYVTLGTHQYIHITSHMEKVLPIVECNHLPEKGKYHMVEPVNFPDDLSSISITYKWNVSPYHLPEQANLDELYEQWKKIEEYSKRNIERIKEKLEEFAKKLSIESRGEEERLVYLTKNNALSQVYSSLEKLGNVVWGQDRNSNEYIQRLATISREVDKHLKELESEIRTITYRKELQELEKQGAKRMDELSKLQTDDPAYQALEKDLKQLEHQKEDLKRKIRREAELQSSTSESSSLDNLGGGYTYGIEKNIFSLDQIHALLPSVGKLYRHNTERYLAIEYWEEYNEAKEEAQRLNAKLCTI